MFNLASFSLSDMTACAAELRKLGAGATSTEEVAERVVQYFYRQLGNDRTGKQDCVLVRYFATRSYRELDPDSQNFARQALGRVPNSPDMKCLTLLATAGERREWNNRAHSRRYRAIPLASEQFVAQFPMFSQLLTQLGVPLESKFEPDSDLLIDWTEQTYNVFYVPDAKGSPFVPVQDEFVIPFGIESVVGFGGVLPSKDLFVVIMFSTVKVPHETAEGFKPLALSVKLALLPFDAAAKTTDHTDSGYAIDQRTGRVEQLQSQVDVLEKLLAVHERTVIHDTGQRKRVEEALRESQERYRLLVTKANDIIYRTDVMGHFTFLNPVAMRILKYSEHDLLGRRFVELIHPDHREAAERFYGLQFVRRRPSTYYEFPALAQDGTEVWIGQNVQVLQEDGKVVGFQAVARDITGRKRVEKALLDNEECLRSIVQSTGDAIILMDSQGKVVFWNRGAEKSFGYAAEEMVGQPVARIVPERLREAHQRGVQRVAAAGRLTVQAGMFELVGLRKDGTEFPLEFSLAAWTAKSGLLITGIMRNISERKLAETALRESEGRYRRLIESLPAAVYTCDAQGHITLYNQAAVALWGREPELGKDLWCGSWRIYRPEGATVPPDQCPMAVAMREGRPIREVEIVIERPDGTRRNVLTHPDPICDESGTVIGSINMLVDITERKQAEEERQKLARDRLLLLDSTGDGIYGIDLEGRCTFINKAGAKTLGYQTDEVLGKDMHQLVHHSFADGRPYPRKDCHIFEVFLSGRGCQIDHEVFWRKDGTAFPVDYTSFPVYEQDIMTGAVVTFLDITERRRLEDALTQRAVRLIKQQSALTDLTQSRSFQSSALMPTLQHITEMAARTLAVERVGIWRYADDRTAIQCMDLYELSRDCHAAETTLPVSSFPGYFDALVKSRIVAADDAHTDDRTAGLSAEYLSRIGISSLMDVPIYLFGRLEGVLCHEHVGPPRRWTEDEQMFAVAVSNLVTLAYEQGERRRAEEQLEQSQERLRSLTARLESIQEEERIRIAREVHDELGQALTGVKLEFASLRDQLPDAGPAVLDRMESISKFIDGTIQSVRKIATELRPVVLDQLGLIPAIEWQAREFQTKTGIQCTLNIYLRTVALPLDRSTGVFRIFQEILTNVTRHAQASGVTITMQEHAGHLLLQVNDNGRGITDDEVSGSRSLGLLGMRERSLLLGGETRIERNPVKGTTVTVRIPIDPQPE